MKLYRGRIGAILLAALITGVLPLLLGLLAGESGSRRDLTLYFFLVFPFVLGSALLGIVGLMIPVEALASRRSAQFAPVAVVAANCFLVWLVLTLSSLSSRHASIPLAAIIVGAPAALLWLGVDRLYRKAFSHA